MHIRTTLLASWLFTAFLAGCSAWFGADSGARNGVSSSLVDYLYPKGEVPPQVDQQIPRLVVPLRVGLAFVALQAVKRQFTDRKYIASIEVIPETYLRSTKGVEGMQQVARLYGADVMALVSYDQVAVTQDNKLAVTYWTIVGAYVIKGTENRTETFVDTAVFDVQSRKLLFRAPGVDSRERSSTAIEAGEVNRATRAASFTAAMNDMTRNLVTELDSFEKRLKTEPQLADVQWKNSSGGGGGADLLTVAIMAALALGRTRNQRH